MGKKVIVIPAFNEETTVAQVVREAIRVCDAVLVVDDGSRDQTAALAAEAGAIVVRHAVNRGLGGALGTGIAGALKLDAAAVVTMDADGQHRAADAERVFARLADGDVDFVIGSRMRRSEEGSGKMPIHRQLLNAVGNVLTYLLFGVWVTDSQSGLRGLSRRAAEGIELRTNGMEVSSEFIKELREKRWRLAEIAIPAIYTTYSLSKGQSFFVGIKTAAKLILRRFIG
jgi:UDP-N-acetylglucosamine---dolichyl-phosphate N-acetylglucosaminyltransferase